MERQIITVDISPQKGIIPRLKVSQGDIGRPLGVNIIQDGVALDCSAYTADLYVLKSDGNYFVSTVTVDSTETNLIKWNTAEQETIVSGECAAQIRITHGEEDIGTARFVEYVEASPGFNGAGSESAVESIKEYVRQAAASAETASSAATSASTSATTATGAASSATSSATAAAGSASSAHTDAETASQAAQTAQDVAASIPADYSQLSDDVTGLKSALNSNLDYTYTEYPGMFLNPQSDGVFVRTTTNNVSLVVIPISPNTKYTVKKETSTVMRMCTANVSTPAYGQVWSNAAYHATASNESLTITSGAEDAYLYIQFWVSSDDEDLQNVEANVSSLVITYVVIGELKSKVDEIGNTQDGMLSHLKATEDAYDGSDAVPLLYLNASGVVVQGAPTIKTRSVIFPILPNTAYTISCELAGKRRIGTFATFPQAGDTASVFVGSQDVTTEDLSITSGNSDGYMLVQFFTGDSETHDITEFLQTFHAYYDGWLPEINRDSINTKFASVSQKLNRQSSRIEAVITIIPSPFRHKMFHDHLLIDKTSGVDVVIPSESIPYIQMSRRLGYENCELNIHETSDGKYIVGHGSGGRFGSAFEHIDGTTDISQVLFNSVTMEWIKANVRFKSLYPKYRVAPPTLEEALYECRVNHLIPFVTASSAGIIEIVENIMGKNNYIAYNGSRSLTDGIIYKYGSYTAVSDIKNDFDAYGPPFIYGFSNPEVFTDEQLIDIANYAHQAGCMVGFSAYVNMAQQQRLIGLGFDFGGTRFAVNDFESGNLCNLSGDIDFSDFTTTGTIDSDYTLRLSTGDTLTPAVTLPTPFLSKGSLHIRYTGTLTFSMGDYISTSIESDGSKTTWVSTYFMRQSPTFTLTAVDDVVIQSLTYKASRA